MKKPVLSSEAVYIMATLTTSLGTSLLAAADFGLSMVVAPSYIISLRFSFLTFGQTGYLIQGLLFIALLCILKKVRILYLFSFLSGFFFGSVLDMWRSFIPFLDPGAHPPGSFSFGIRIFCFIAGFLLNSLGVTLYFHTYIYPQVYEFFVKKICEKYQKDLPAFKLCFDLVCLAISLSASLILFRRLRGIGAGTVIISFLNGYLIKLYGNILNRYVIIRPRWESFAARFAH